MNGKVYPKGTVFQLLLSGRVAASVINEWWEASTQTDVRIRKAKTKGCFVLETEDTIFVAHIIKLWPGTKVNIKEPK
ncbi:MAG: RNA polymerase subunit sigma [Prevotella sp.]|nr:RNA polymerase subunit sigma [Prevotella sp.]